MKPLENRRWYQLATLLLALLGTAGLWTLAGLPLRLAGLTVFVFAALGLWQAVNRVMAIALIRAMPSLGAVG